MSEEPKVYATAEAIRAEEYTDFTAPITGRVYRLRKVWVIDLVRDGVLSIPNIGNLEALQKKADGETPLDEFERAQIALFQTAMICRGVSIPRVVDCPVGQAPAGALSVDEFPRADFDAVFLAVCAFSGLGEDAWAAQKSVVSDTPREGESFRGEEGAGVHAGEAPHE